MSIIVETNIANDNKDYVVWSCACGGYHFFITPVGFQCASCMKHQRFKGGEFKA